MTKFEKEILVSVEEFSKAIDSLHISINLLNTSLSDQPNHLELHKALRDSCIQRFEFSVELCWKFLKRILEDKGVEVVYPRDVIRTAFAGRLINDEALWLSMLDDRNLTSHTYDEDLADEIFAHIPAYYQAMRDCLLSLS